MVYSRVDELPTPAAHDFAVGNRRKCGRRETLHIRGESGTTGSWGTRGALPWLRKRGGTNRFKPGVSTWRGA